MLCWLLISLGWVNQIGNEALVLMDVGCEYHGYVSDMTRTWPPCGYFTAARVNFRHTFSNRLVWYVEQVNSNLQFVNFPEAKPNIWDSHWQACILSSSETSLQHRTGCNEGVFQDVPPWRDPVSNTQSLCKFYCVISRNLKKTRNCPWEHYSACSKSWWIIYNLIRYLK